ncbi:mitochondrial rho 1 [Stylonychia lemnae]|uniref:Mitochondrial rho 1 n=1 Tax=Stylonychia lemnae TaxID=5949 RepID=A0A078A8G8_STYLE|nr:mitochondrial rho 1 [Stylonychia lemnae]|eukprot:CDW77076.1 mitochondrial rho 1 [Stylonychia lemnae]
MVLKNEYLTQNIEGVVQIQYFSASKDDEQATDSEIDKASVIILVYDVNNLECMKRLRSYWMPRIIKINDKIPIIFVGNKMDLRSSHVDNNDLESTLSPYFMEFKQVEMGLECSAKGYMNLIDVIYCAQRAVQFPISPLFDSISKQLKPEFEKALLRIFRICDADQDGFLNDNELQEFQNQVFKAELQKKHITALKEVLILECEDYDETSSLKGVNIEAFKALQKVLIQKLKQQTCWSILRHFGYDDKLLIKQNLWDDGSVKDEDLDNCKSVELSKSSWQYLHKIFECFKVPLTSKLDEGALEKIFATTENGIPWKVKYVTNYENGISLDQWIAMWQKFFSQSPKTAFKNLVYLGFQERFRDAVQIYKYKESDLLKPQNKRKVFNCYVLGTQYWPQMLDHMIQSQVEQQEKDAPERSIVKVITDQNNLKRNLIVKTDKDARVQDQQSNVQSFVKKLGVEILQDFTVQKEADQRRIKELEELLLSVVIEPSRGISTQGQEMIRKAKGSDDSWLTINSATGVASALVFIIGAGIAGLYYTGKISFSFASKSSK